jgi:hypothetical protein
MVVSRLERMGKKKQQEAYENIREELVKRGFIFLELENVDTVSILDLETELYTKYNDRRHEIQRVFNHFIQ